MKTLSCLAYLVSFKNCKFETDLRKAVELPVGFLAEQLETIFPENAIPYLIVEEMDQAVATGQTTENIIAIYRVDGPHQRTIQPKNLTLIWKRAGVHKATPSIWLDERQTADRLRKIVEAIKAKNKKTATT